MNQVNPVLAMLSNATQNSGTMASSNPMQMMAQFAEFKKTMQGKNPEAIVKQMLMNGRSFQITMEWYSRTIKSVGTANRLQRSTKKNLPVFWIISSIVFPLMIRSTSIIARQMRIRSSAGLLNWGSKKA